MNREILRALIEDWMQAERILTQIKDRNRCGSPGSDLDPALNRVLDSILTLMKRTHDDTQPETGGHEPL